MRHGLFGSLAALVLASGSLVLAAPTVGSAARNHADAQDSCQGSSTSSARVMKGTSKWMDPNTLTREQVKTHESRTKQIVAGSRSNPSSRPNGSVHISVDFHVVTDNAGNGGVSASRINAQIAVLNQASQDKQAPGPPTRPSGSS